MKIKGLLVAIVFLASLSSCTVLKEYEKVYVNDEEMLLSSRALERFEMTFQIYREAAAGANGGKTGGGCECN